MKNHKESVHDLKLHQCDLCEYKNKWKVALLEHKREKHGIFTNVTDKTVHLDCESQQRVSMNIREEYMVEEIIHVILVAMFQRIHIIFPTTKKSPSRK